MDFKILFPKIQNHHLFCVNLPEDKEGSEESGQLQLQDSDFDHSQQSLSNYLHPILANNLIFPLQPPSSPTHRIHLVTFTPATHK
ncbi:hypothetical protein ACFX13_027999 [Malus domestica]